MPNVSDDGGAANRRAPGADALVDALRKALRAARMDWADAPLQVMVDQGLAHHHVRLVGTGLIARLPKQSQMALGPQANLKYEEACFAHACASGHSPRVTASLAPDSHLPRGALLVEEVIGRAARLPADLPAIAMALAAIHSLPLPPPVQREPLLDVRDPMTALAAEIDAQAAYLPGAQLDADSLACIQAVRIEWQEHCAREDRPARRLIAFDAHPGNFLIDSGGRAVLVDLEKARYSHPPLDLAHATLYTSTTWDIASSAVLAPADVLRTYAGWEDACDLGASQRAWLAPLRTAMWLWSITWCAKWRVSSPRPPLAPSASSDWSQHHSAAALVEHVRDRVNDYLSPGGVHRVINELVELRQAWRT